MRLAPLDTTKMEVCGRIATTPSALELCTAALSTFMDLVCPGDVVQLCKVGRGNSGHFNVATGKKHPLDSCF